MRYKVGLNSKNVGNKRPNTPRKIHGLYFSGTKNINKTHLYATPGGSKRSESKKVSFKQAISRLFIILFGIGVFAFAIVMVVLAIYLKNLENSLPDSGKLLDRSSALSTQIFDRNGTLLYTFYGDENREFIKIDELKPYTKWALLSAEDIQFYEHKGLDLTGVVRAGLQYVKILPGSTGASTISQQLVRNTLLKDVLGQDAYDRTITRKVKEMLLTMQMEQKYTKDEILQMYMNEVFLGGVNYGFQAASKAYFGKDVRQLSLAESALLAGIVQSPSVYAPIGGTNPELAVDRQKYVLDQMLKHKDVSGITQEDYDNALKEVLVYKSINTDIKAPHFVFYVKKQLDDLYGPDVVTHGGLKVTTTLDYSMQKIAESEIKSGIAKYGKKWNVNNGAMVAIDPKTGDILTMVGSIDYNSKNPKIDGNVNITLSPRQMGSSVKPYTYLTAFSQGYGPWLLAPDMQMNFGNYKLANWDGKYYGPMTARQGLIQSRNLPAVYTAQLIGVENFIKTAQAFGITTLGSADRYGLSITLGTPEMKLLEHVGGYTVFANGGIKRDYRAILEVKDSSGNVVLERKNNEGKRIWDEKEIYELNWILCDLGGFGDQPENKNYLYNGRRTFCGKTGTTNGPRDLTAILYTKSLVVGVWAGNNDNTETPGAWSTTVPLPIAGSFMTKMAGKYKPEPFNRPAGIVSGTVCNDTGELASKDNPCKKVSTIYISDKAPKTDEREKLYICNDSGKVSTNETFARSFSLGTDYYLIKKKLENSAQQSSYEAYMKKNSKVVFDKPDSADCQLVADPSGAPKIQVSTPTNGENIYPNSTINITAYATAGVPITKVEFLVDGTLVYTDNSAPYGTSYNVPAVIASGTHTITAIVYDSLARTASSNVSVNVSGGVVSISISSPVVGTHINALPTTFSALTVGTGITKVDFILSGPSSYAQVLTDNNGGDGWSVSFGDNAAPNGAYQIQARAYKGSSLFYSSPVSFTLNK